MVGLKAEYADGVSDKPKNVRIHDSGFIFHNANFLGFKAQDSGFKYFTNTNYLDAAFRIHLASHRIQDSWIQDSCYTHDSGFTVPGSGFNV